jgi:hypothetical protein
VRRQSECDCPAKGAPCVRCSYRNCSRFCDRVEHIDCSQRLLRAGKVCNGCPDERRCHKRKLFYVAGRAQDDYRRILSESRQGAAFDGLYAELGPELSGDEVVRTENAIGQPCTVEHGVPPFSA